MDPLQHASANMERETLHQQIERETLQTQQIRKEKHCSINKYRKENTGASANIGETQQEI